MQQVNALDADLAPHWDALLERCAPDSPLLSSHYLRAMEQTGCVGPGTGWGPAHLLLWDASKRPTNGQLVAACPLYRKTHSYGEYVFDWAWADAYARNGLDYYPKFLCALPFTPVPGARLLAIDDAARLALAKALLAATKDKRVSSCHILLPDDAGATALQAAGFMRRQGVQFHWSNRDFADFEHFLESLAQPKRKKIRAERRKVAEAGVTFKWLDGNTASSGDWQFFYRCYANTYAQHHSTPYLRPEFFTRLARALPAQTLLCIAMRDQLPVAASFCLRSGSRLYGRYWGALEYVPCLHFEACYYQPIQYAIEHGVAVFEGGAQGEHKMARGLEPVATTSWHWLAHPAFADAVERFLERETSGMELYLDDLNERTPFKSQSAKAAD